MNSSLVTRHGNLVKTDRMPGLGVCKAVGSGSRINFMSKVH